MTRFMPLLALFGIFSANSVSLPDSLLRCDNSFFSELHAQQKTLKKAAPMAQDNKNHAWFIPAKDGGDTMWFSQPIKTKQLTLLGYYQSYTDLKEMGKYYYWGFIIDESPEAIIAATQKVRWQKSGTIYMAMTMIRHTDDNEWKENMAAADGIAPAKGTIEKLAMTYEYNGKSLLTCSVQGDVTNSVLLPLRPDLDGGK